ncbi:MAG: hypothetical protein AAF383_16515 [Cyanobacteria bacterium P01_A01_bin.83]
MSEIELRNLAEGRNQPTGSNLLSDSETYLTDVTEEELDGTLGGFQFPTNGISGYINGNSPTWKPLGTAIWTGFTAGPITKGPSVVN